MKSDCGFIHTYSNNDSRSFYEYG